MLRLSPWVHPIERSIQNSIHGTTRLSPWVHPIVEKHSKFHSWDYFGHLSANPSAIQYIDTAVLLPKNVVDLNELSSNPAAIHNLAKGYYKSELVVVE
jgi:hypothetical protein